MYDAPISKLSDFVKKAEGNWKYDALTDSDYGRFRNSMIVLVLNSLLALGPDQIPIAQNTVFATHFGEKCSHLHNVVDLVKNHWFLQTDDIEELDNFAEYAELVW